MSQIDYGGTAQLTDGTYITFLIEYDNLTAEEKVVFDDFVALNASNGYHFTIANAPYTIDSGICCVLTVLTDTLTDLDYQTMTVEDQAKVDAFETLLRTYQR